MIQNNRLFISRKDDKHGRNTHERQVARKNKVGTVDYKHVTGQDEGGRKDDRQISRRDDSKKADEQSCRMCLKPGRQ